MTLRDKFKKCKDASNTYYVLPIADDAEQLEQIADDYAIEILESYHNSLFNIPLKEGEAKRIVDHIKKQNVK
jgi:hypothetical protein